MLEMLSKIPWLQRRKATHVDEPMEDWYLEGLVILEHSKRVKALQAQMRRSVLLEPGFYLELLVLAVLGWVSLKQAQSDSSPHPYWQVGLVLILVIQLIQRFERVSIARLEACLKLAVLSHRKAAMPSRLESPPPQSNTPNPGSSGQTH
jgi:uncharacterized membrane protein